MGSARMTQPSASEATQTAVTPSPFARAARVAGAAWFLLLATVNARNAVLAHDLLKRTSALTTWSHIVSDISTVAFFLVLSALMIIRPEAKARRAGLLARVVALAGTYGVWVITFLPRQSLIAPLEMLSGALTVVGGLLILYALSALGRSFSIGPQARVLVTRGPYRLIRHPLYAAEEFAVIGLAMGRAWYAAIPFILIHLALQIWRMNYEEGVLRSVFPEYADYARRTRRLIPGIW